MLPERIDLRVATAVILQGMTAHFLAHSAYSLRVRIDREVPLADAAAAHRALESWETSGKVLLVP